jgi:hypothetical protein
VSNVTNLNDSGVGSLRYQLGRAHDGDTINFDPSLNGTITLTPGGVAGRPGREDRGARLRQAVDQRQ